MKNPHRQCRLIMLLLLQAFITGACSISEKAPEHPVMPLPASTSTMTDSLPVLPREFRAAWIATVDNIDWPSEPGLSDARQQQEIITLLDSAAALGLNALILQVRPQCDAIYPSELEPWSYYLSGEQGRGPGYDPLAFWIREAHLRGIDLHAWFNPYRAHHPRGGPISTSSIVRTRPDLARDTGNGYYWLVPTLPETQQYSYAVIMDVLQRYDIDGVHFDDYFYPYGDGSFPDDESWQAYQTGGGALTRADWRRAAVNSFVERVAHAIRATKPHVRFGISPFGIWRPGNPPSIKGYDQFDKLFADARLWLREGWVDYWAPQLYWPIRQVPQSYPVLLNWWQQQNLQQRHLWPGMHTRRFTGREDPNEILNQIMISRGFLPGSPGHIHFSMRAFRDNEQNINNLLKKGPYLEEALIPARNWMTPGKVAVPRIEVERLENVFHVQWEHPQPRDIRQTVLYSRYGSQWRWSVHPPAQNQLSLALSDSVILPATYGSTGQRSLDSLNRVIIRAIDRNGVMSESREIVLK